MDAINKNNKKYKTGIFIWLIFIHGFGLVLEILICSNSDRTQTHTHNTKTYLQQHVLHAPVFVNIDSINTLRTRLCLGICSTWLKMKLVNISLYTVSDIHEYRKMPQTVATGCYLQIGHVPFISSLIRFLLISVLLIGPGSVLGFCVTTDKHWLQKFLRNSSATIRALALTDSFISLISLSISSMKWMT